MKKAQVKLDVLTGGLLRRFSNPEVKGQGHNEVKSGRIHQLTAVRSAEAHLSTLWHGGSFAF